MIYLDLVFNLSLMVALSVVSNFIEKHWRRNTRWGLLLQGILFGGTAVLGMLRPINLESGVFFDGRTIVVSLCALFFGPLAASAAGVMAIACRISLGGPGTIPGLLAILISITIGLLARFRFKPEVEASSVQKLYLFGLVVHLSTLAVMLSLVGIVGLNVVMRIGPPMLLLNPLVTVLAGKILSDQVVASRNLTALKKNEALLKETQALSKVGGWEWDVITGHITWTDEVYKIYGVKAEDYDPDDTARDMRFYAPEVVPVLKQAFESALNHGVAYDLESEFIPANGGRIWVRTIGKPQLRDKKVIRIAGYIMDITERRQMEAAQIESEKRFRLLVESSPDAIFLETKGRFTYLNQSAVVLFGGTTSDDLVETPVLDHFHPDSRKAVGERIRLLYQEKTDFPILEGACLRMDGSSVDVEVSAVLIQYEGRRSTLSFMRDISDRVEKKKAHSLLQEQLAQAQKMESVGRLAGGVAHDYNNMLSVIIGYSELALDKIGPQEPLYADLKQILQAAQRSTDITRQLLAFARQQTIAPKVLDLNDTVESMLKMLRRLIGEDIDLAWHPRAISGLVKMDPTQVDQILANLCINARDAIADVGKITIETDTATFDKTYCADHAGFVPGDFVMLAVSDDGSGMDTETLDKVFEPFFTTKRIGRGTGLGLATVYGIVKQNEGFINVYSEPGKGTTFKIYLTRRTGQAIGDKKSDVEDIPKGHGELVLVVEDETLVLKLVEKMLNDLGYRVLLAKNPIEALQLVERPPGDLSLLMTDVVMPEMNGRELSDRLQSLYPKLQCLFMSGYTANVIAHRGILEEGVNFIQKPFSNKDLAFKVREALDNTRT